MRGTEKQIAFAESVRQSTIDYINQEIDSIRANHDRGYRHVEAAIAAGDSKKADRATEQMNRLAKRMRLLALAALIIERADDAAFILDMRDCPYNMGDSVRFNFYIRKALDNGYITAEEAESIN